MSVASILLSIQFWERSRSLIDEENRFEGQGPWMTGSSAVCLPCSAVLDSSSSTEERLLSEVFFAGHGFGSRAENEGGLSSGDKDTCCAKSKRQLRTLLKMFLDIRTRLHKEHGTVERGRCLVFPSVESSSRGIRCILDRREVAETAHLTGARLASNTGSDDSTGDSRTDGVLDWTSKSVFQGRLESTNDGRLTCRSGGGVYFVYTQIYFVEYDDARTIGNERTISHAVSVFINRFQNQTRKTEALMERSEGRCSRSTLTAASLCEYTVYTASLVELADGDSVYVTVSHPYLVNDDDKVTYFGLQKVT